MTISLSARKRCSPPINGSKAILQQSLKRNHLIGPIIVVVLTGEASLSAIGGVETDLKQGMKLFFEFKVGLAHDDPDIKLAVGLSW
jgi:hypothetical protein